MINGWELQHHLSDTECFFYSKVSNGSVLQCHYNIKAGYSCFDTLDHLDEFGCGVIGYIEQEVKQVEGF